MTKTPYYTVTTYLQSWPLKSLKTSLQLFTKATHCMFLAQLVVYYYNLSAQWLILLFQSTLKKCWIEGTRWFMYSRLPHLVCDKCDRRHNRQCQHAAQKKRTQCLKPSMVIATILTSSVWRLSYLDLLRSLSWLLMPWFLASPDHQQPWYWLCEIGKSWSFRRKE